jgi:peptidoglycan/LPS O-acetylase OafA/YrhL
LLTCVFLAFAVLFLIAELPAETTHVVRSRGPLDLYDGQNYGPVVRCLIEFGIGMVCFRVSQVRAVAAAMGRGWVSLGLLLLIGGLLSVRDADIWVVPAVALLLMSGAEDRNGVARFLGQPIFHWLGTISYSIYLFHTMVAAMVGPGIQRAVEATGVRGALGFEVLCLVAVVLATATLTYSLVERPGRRWVQGLFALRRRAGEGNPNLAAP